MPRTLLVCAALTILALATGRAQDWPAFRGLDGQGHSLERGLPADWSETTNVLWKTRVPGLGWSSPVVAAGRVWLTSSVDADDIVLRALAFDAESGSELTNVELFRLKAARIINPKNSFASPTPVIDGDRVYVHFGADGTAALTLSGDVIWKTTLRYESQHGAGGSPVVYGDLLVFNCDGLASTAVSRGSFFIRTDSHLYRIADRGSRPDEV